jgi:hypothetical protein
MWTGSCMSGQEDLAYRYPVIKTHTEFKQKNPMLALRFDGDHDLLPFHRGKEERQSETEFIMSLYPFYNTHNYYIDCLTNWDYSSNSKHFWH